MKKIFRSQSEQENNDIYNELHGVYIYTDSQVQLRSQDEVADVSNSGFTVAPGFYTRVAIQRQTVSVRSSLSHSPVRA